MTSIRGRGRLQLGEMERDEALHVVAVEFAAMDRSPALAPGPVFRVDDLHGATSPVRSAIGRA